MAKEKTPAQKKAQAAYMARFSNVPVKMEKDLHERVKAAAAEKGMAMNTYIVQAILAALDREPDLAAARSVAADTGATVQEVLDSAAVGRAVVLIDSVLPGAAAAIYSAEFSDLRKKYLPADGE